MRVAVFYRVSTKKQMKASDGVTRTGKQSARKVSQEDELPLQRKECERLIQEKGWTFTGLEYIEGGVSGFHTHTSKRKELQRAYEDAKAGHYDVLLLYKLDRFGRRAAESLEFALRFLRHVRIWTTDRGEFRQDGDADEIKNFVEFWSAKRASSDTKKRVTDAMMQIHEEGLWTGGNTPYGYSNHPDLSLKLVINEPEAEVVRQIFRMYNSGMGFLRIANYLNDHGYKPRETDMWKSSNLMRMLRNPIYKGHLAYGKTKTVEGEFGGAQVRVPESEWSVNSKRIEEYAIVDEEDWDRAQRLREERSRKMPESDYQPKKTPSNNKMGKHLLSGFTFCAYCGSPMTIKHEQSHWKTADGEKKTNKRVVYKCKTRLQGGRTFCTTPKASIVNHRLENAVISQVKNFTSELANSDFFKDIQTFTQSGKQALDHEYQEIVKELEKQGKLKDKANEMLKKIFLGEEIPFSEEQVSEMYKEASKSIDELNKRKDELQDARSQEELNNEELGQLVAMISDWGILFDQADDIVKKQMLTKIVERVDVFEDTAKVHINMKIAEFFEVVMGARIEVAASWGEVQPNTSFFVYDGSAHGKQYSKRKMVSVINKLHQQFRTPITRQLKVKLA